mmetsp:Transcript_23573/g.44897  ORF Transcript_23573/g.44897 Transcript_23573/m.44897 type:complete len:559 (+) Transcript_23573:130-1806(+)
MKKIRSTSNSSKKLRARSRRGKASRSSTRASSVASSADFSEASEALQLQRDSDFSQGATTDDEEVDFTRSRSTLTQVILGVESHRDETNMSLEKGLSSLLKQNQRSLGNPPIPRIEDIEIEQVSLSMGSGGMVKLQDFLSAAMAAKKMVKMFRIRKARRKNIKSNDRASLTINPGMHSERSVAIDDEEENEVGNEADNYGHSEQHTDLETDLSQSPNPDESHLVSRLQPEISDQDELPTVGGVGQQRIEERKESIGLRFAEEVSMVEIPRRATKEVPRQTNQVVQLPEVITPERPQSRQTPLVSKRNRKALVRSSWGVLKSLEPVQTPSHHLQSHRRRPQTTLAEGVLVLNIRALAHRPNSQTREVRPSGAGVHEAFPLISQKIRLPNPKSRPTIPSSNSEGTELGRYKNPTGPQYSPTTPADEDDFDPDLYEPESDLVADYPSHEEPERYNEDEGKARKADPWIFLNDDEQEDYQDLKQMESDLNILDQQEQSNREVGALQRMQVLRHDPDWMAMQKKIARSQASKPVTTGYWPSNAYSYASTQRIKLSEKYRGRKY